MAVPTALAGASWRALSLIVLAVVIATVALCWAIADAGRARRLAALIRAWRGDAMPPASPGHQAPAARGPRRTAAGKSG